jgi:hypothetical protein
MVFGKKNKGAQTRLPLIAIWILLASLFALGFYYTFSWALRSEDTQFVRGMVINHKPPPPTLDKGEYDRLMYELANYPVVGTSTASTTKVLSIASSTKPWPVSTAPYPKYGALLPFNRIVAYYGNFLSKGMGVLGEYPEEEMLAKLKATVADWQAADPSIPVIPAIHYIVVTAQASAGRDGMYRARMSDSQVEKALEVAKKIDGIVFLDFQVGFSTVDKELPQYEKYLSLPNVHIGLDPEFSMKGKHPPGKIIGTMDASDINWAANYLAGLVKEHDLPPKILMIHRFTHDMLTNYQDITPLPEVQIVVDMDGWGDQAKKIGTYTHVVAAEPVQFTGFKIFYKNDLFAPSTGLFTPEQVLKLSPIPSYIQYQ